MQLPFLEHMTFTQWHPSSQKHLAACPVRWKVFITEMQQWADLKAWLSQQTSSTGLQLAAGHSSELQRGQALSGMQVTLQPKICV